MILDIIIIFLIALSIFLGYKKGLAKLAIKFVALALSILITVVLYIPVSNLVINLTNIDETVETHIYDKVLNLMEEENNQNKSYIGITTKQVEEGLLPDASRQLAINIIKLAVFLILMIISKIILRCINKLTDLITSLPLLKQFNEIGGALYGLLRGVLVLYIALLLVQYVAQLNPENIVYRKIDETYITKFMYEKNILNVFFKQ